MLRVLSKKLHNVRYVSTNTKLTEIAIDKNGIATLTLTKTPANSLDYELSNQILMNLKDLEKDRIRGLILTSNVKNIFCAGLHIHGLYKKTKEDTQKLYRAFLKVWLTLYSASYPTAALINGHAPAGGCALAVSCEHRIMLNNFKIGINEVLLGVTVPPWLIHGMTTTTNPRVAESACVAGLLYDTKDAHKIGLVDEIADDFEDGLAKATKFINSFNKVNTHARYLTKQSVRGDAIKDLQNNFEKNVVTFVDNIYEDYVQSNIGLYLEALKKK